MRKEHLDLTQHEPRQSRVPQRCTVVSLTDETPTVKSVCLKVAREPPAEFVFRAGQWVDFYVDGVPEVGGFSVTSTPRQLRQDGTLSLAVKRSAHPPARWVHNECRPGASVQVIAGGAFTFPMGPEDTGRDLLLLAGGIGINPLLSILRDVVGPDAEAGPPLPQGVALLYSACSTQETAFEGPLRSLAEQRGGGLHLQFYSTRESGGAGDGRRWYRRMGAEDIATAVGSLARPVCYMCGPPGMLRDLEGGLQEGGVAAGDIRQEKWW